MLSIRAHLNKHNTVQQPKTSTALTMWLGLMKDEMLYINVQKFAILGMEK
jgi:hypothetical protein